MKVVQWSMTVSNNLHQEFIEYSQNVLKPTWFKFGAIDYRLFEGENKFIEQLFFPEDFNPEEFFAKVKSDPKANEVSKSYEQHFQATNIQKEVLNQL